MIAIVWNVVGHNSVCTDAETNYFEFDCAFELDFLGKLCVTKVIDIYWRCQHFHLHLIDQSIVSFTLNRPVHFSVKHFECSEYYKNMQNKRNVEDIRYYWYHWCYWYYLAHRNIFIYGVKP